MNTLPDTVDAWLDYQRGLNPQQIDLGLERLRPVARRMNLARKSTPLITVAGTNGKGSSVALIESLARSHDLSSVSYTSPWLLRCNENFRIDGCAASDEILLDAFHRVEAARDGVPLTEFEFRTLAAAHIAFAQRADVVVFEVGLGGRLDAVNLFDASVALVTSIALDHQRWLGNSRELIAGEKAGIARRNAPLISAEADSNALLEPHARAAGALPVLAQCDYRFGIHDVRRGDSAIAGKHPGWWYRAPGMDFACLPVPALRGRHQIANAAASITALSLLGLGTMDAERTARALSAVSLAGRVQQLVGAPLRFVDVAHNPHAAVALAQWAGEQTSGCITALCAMYADKDMYGTLHALRDVVHTWHLAPLPAPRGAAGEVLAVELGRAVPQASAVVHASIDSGWQAACEAADPHGLLLGFGSFETVSAILRLERAANRHDTGSQWTSK